MSNHYAMCKYDDATGTYIPLEVRPYIDDFQAGAASLDAEVAELKATIARFNSSPTIEACRQMIEAQAVKENDQLHADAAELRRIIDEEAKDSAQVIIERDQLRVQISKLLDAFQTFIDEHEECAILS